MSRSKKWKREWSFFLGKDGRRKYNAICRRCQMDCKQSFRAVLLECPKFTKKTSKKRPF
ncbi:MAG: hypothetical protein IKR46_00460 [Clostridia bacterium]|nr:hypothetical protein [Clostridia bacterium]